MVLALDALWFGVLLLLVAVFCTASLMNVYVWFALILVIIIAGLALTAVSVVNKRRREKIQIASDETMLIEYLKSHGIGGNLSELAVSLGIAENRALELLLSMEKRGAIPEGSTKALEASLPEIASARTAKVSADIKEKAVAVQVSTSEIESKQTICSQCGKPAGKGKFCNNCGAPLSFVQCPKCGAKSPTGTQFCGECGTKLV